MRSTSAALALLVVLPATARASPADCRRWRIGVGVTSTLSLAAIGGGIGLASEAYAMRQDAHTQPTLGAYHAAFREAGHLETAAGGLAAGGAIVGVVTGLAALFAFTGGRHGVCPNEKPRASLDAPGLRVRF